MMRNLGHVCVFNFGCLVCVVKQLLCTTFLFVMYLSLPGHMFTSYSITISGKWHMRVWEGGFLRLKRASRQYFWHSAVVATGKSLD